MTRRLQIGLALAAVTALCAALPLTLSTYSLGIGLDLLMWIALAESWAMFSGLSGYVSLGHAVFYGVGAYVAAQFALHVSADFVLSTLAAMAVTVDRVGSERRARQALADQADQAELERARLAVLEQRTRFARELHDVVAHHMSLMAIRAESAPHRLGALPDPEQVRAEFGALSGSARDALADMRRLLGVLRSDQPAARAPQPGLLDLPALIDTARQAGMTVQLSPLPVPGQVPPSAGVCAYRIIQEALSNAGRHAAGAPVTVSVHYDADTVTLRVTHGPQASAPPRANGHRPGHGLAGMRERAELLGGSLSAGPAPDGGVVVSPVLPPRGSAA